MLPVPNHTSMQVLTVNADLTATISPLQYWPGLLNASMKFFSWYPYSDANAPTASFIDPGEWCELYSEMNPPPIMIDVLAAYRALYGLKVSNMTLLPHIDQSYLYIQEVAPVPNEVTIEKIEFQNVGKAVTLR